MATESIEYTNSVIDVYCPAMWGVNVPFAQELAEELDEWNLKSTIDWYQVEVAVAEPKEVDIAKEFSALASEWKEATWPISSLKKRIAHPAYLQIIGMGPVAIPLLLKELRREPDHWHYALEAITRQNPVPADADMKALVEAWLTWGERRGYYDHR